jgi:hypothetical protein
LYNYRGFGFVIYKDPAAVEKVLASGPHQLDSKMVTYYVSFVIYLLKYPCALMACGADAVKVFLTQFRI